MGQRFKDEEMIEMRKQVLLYFIDKPVNPSKVDMAQHEKIQIFKESCKSKGIYSLISSETELKNSCLAITQRTVSVEV